MTHYDTLSLSYLYLLYDIVTHCAMTY